MLCFIYFGENHAAERTINFHQKTLLAWVRVRFLPLAHASVFIVKLLKCFTGYSLGSRAASWQRALYSTTRAEACKIHKESLYSCHFDLKSHRRQKTKILKFACVLYQNCNTENINFDQNRDQIVTKSIRAGAVRAPNALWATLWGARLEKTIFWWFFYLFAFRVPSHLELAMVRLSAGFILKFASALLRRTFPACRWNTKIVKNT